MLNSVHNSAKKFTEEVGREFAAFPQFQRNQLAGVDIAGLLKRINDHKTKWMKDLNAA